MERIIRTMAKEDLDEVEAIEKSAFSVPWSRASLEDAMNMPDNVYIVCEENGRIAGYCGMWTVFGEGNIVSVAVEEHCRKRGIALDMMKELEKKGIEKKVDIFFLEVRKSNYGAISLYEKAGFRNVGVRRNFYEKPCEDALIMSKIISRRGSGV